MAFKFELGAAVTTTISRQAGVVVGRAEYMEALPDYLIRYANADGEQVQNWFSEGSLEPLED